ncbi:MAG TPA: bifunctional riboflavin kinase/FAD synthetase [Clostridiales bacterium]|nr:bifunctional riboflavin kinase/FAD synthetase [Clostridiales bacterium]
MKVLSTINDMSIGEDMGVGLGNFDGLHIGHMALTNILKNECKISSLQSMIYTFSKHPDNILKKDHFTPLLMTPEKKMQILEYTSVDYLFYQEFDETFSKMEPVEFVKCVLVDKLGIKLAVAGFDYTFGYKGQGDARLLRQLGEKYNFKVIIVPPIKVNNEVVSSTLIREYLSRGDMEKALFMLGRHYSIMGRVETGYRIGTKLGFPTANITPEEYLLLPSFGVYISKTLLDGKIYNSITNLGVKPTVKTSTSKVSIETHILDFEGDIYQKPIEVFFIRKIRDEKKFKSHEELVKQIKADVSTARNLFEKHIV